MLSKIKASILWLIIVGMLNVFGSDWAWSDDALQHREKLAREEVVKTPDSEKAHLHLAGILIEQRRYIEAKSEIAAVQKLNPNNPALPSMLKVIEIQESNLSPEEKLDAAMKNLSESMKLLEVPILEGRKERYDSEKAELDVRYGVSTYQYPIEKRTAFFQAKKLIGELRKAGKNEEALNLSQTEVDKYPDSCEARIDHIQLLLDLSKLEEAQALTQRSLEMFTGHPMLRILLDGIADIRAAPSLELREQLLNKTRLRLLKANLIKVESIVKAQNFSNGRTIEQKAVR